MKIFITMLLAAAIHICHAQNIVQAEYAVDVDKGFGKNTLVMLPASPDGSFSFMVNLTTATRGYHKLYIRTKDENGLWNTTLRQNIEVIDAGAVINIVGGEYFFDNDPGMGAANAIAISPQSEAVLQNFTAITNQLAVGYHKLYMRFKDDHNQWGQTTRQNIELLSSVNPVIAGVEYFFKTDAGVGKADAISFASLSADSSFAFKIPLDKIPTGTKTLYLRAKDATNHWSITQWKQDSVVTSSGLDSLWSHPATWSNGKVPDSNTVVILHHKVYVDIDTATCKSLAPYRNAAECIVQPGRKLKVVGHR